MAASAATARSTPLFDAAAITPSSQGVPGWLRRLSSCTSTSGGAAKAKTVALSVAKTVIQGPEGAFRMPRMVNCVKLGRELLGAAAALATLEHAGFSPAAQDISVEKLSEEALSRARLVLISVPMHTALQLGVRVAAKARAAKAQVGFFGLYATLNAAHLRERHGEFVAGENAEELVALARSIEEGRVPQPVVPRKRDGVVPSRAALPVLDRYAKLSWNGEERLVASVEASQGCKHLCRHCPIVPV